MKTNGKNGWWERGGNPSQLGHTPRNLPVTPQVCQLLVVEGKKEGSTESNANPSCVVSFPQVGGLCPILQSRTCIPQYRDIVANCVVS